MSQVLRGGSDLIGGNGGDGSASCDVICSDALPTGQSYDVIHVNSPTHNVFVASSTYMQVGFAVADGSEALHSFIRCLSAPGAMTVPIETTYDDCTVQQLTLVTKANQIQHHAKLSRA
jgi:hypothetical protein